MTNNTAPTLTDFPAAKPFQNRKTGVSFSKYDGPAYQLTLQHAGFYRGKRRYIIDEIPTLGATVTPEVEAARWLLLQGACPTEKIVASYPDGDGFPLILGPYRPGQEPETIHMNPHITPLSQAAHVFRTNWCNLSKNTRIVGAEEFEACLEKPVALFGCGVATRFDDKIGAETRKQLKQGRGLVLDDYAARWQRDRAADLQEEAAKWIDGRNYWRPTEIWKATKHLDKAAYGAAMAARCRWEAERILNGNLDRDSHEARAEFLAKDYDVNLMPLPLRRWIDRRVEKGNSVIEACRLRIEHEANRKAKNAAKAEAEEAEKAAARQRADSYLRANWGLSIPLGAWSFEFEGKTRRILDKRDLVDQSTGKAAKEAIREAFGEPETGPRLVRNDFSPSAADLVDNSDILAAEHREEMGAREARNHYGDKVYATDFA
jgi:hypothetical protein